MIPLTLIPFFIIDSLENNFCAFFRRIGLDVRAKLNQLPSSRGLKIYIGQPQIQQRQSLNLTNFKGRMRSEKRELTPIYRITKFFILVYTLNEIH